jgi:hypothetical protein
MPLNGALMVIFSVRQLITVLLTPAAEFAAKKHTPAEDLSAEALAEKVTPYI